MTGTHSAPPHPAAGAGISGSSIRHARFSEVGRRQVGLDPKEVYPYLQHVAAEVDALTTLARSISDENERFRAMLADWHRRSRPTPTDDGYGSSVRPQYPPLSPPDPDATSELGQDTRFAGRGNW